MYVGRSSEVKVPGSTDNSKIVIASTGYVYYQTQKLLSLLPDMFTIKQHMNGILKKDNRSINDVPSGESKKILITRLCIPIKIFSNFLANRRM